MNEGKAAGDGQVSEALKLGDEERCGSSGIGPFLVSLVDRSVLKSWSVRVHILVSFGSSVVGYSAGPPLSELSHQSCPFKRDI